MLCELWDCSDSFSDGERLMMHTATALMLEKLNVRQKYAHPISSPTASKTRESAEDEELAASTTLVPEQKGMEELHRVLKVAMRLKLFQQPHRSNVSWTSGRYHRFLTL